MNMKKKIIGILVCTLLIAAAVLPVAGTVTNNVVEDQNQVDQVESEPQYGNTNMADEWPMFQHDPNNMGYIDSISPQTNRVKWIFQYGGQGSSIDAGVSIVDNKVYVGSNDEYFYCLDTDTGDILWQNEQPGGASVCCPAVVNGMVYQGDSDDYFYCWDADTGVEIWKFKKGSGISFSPSVADGKVYAPKIGVFYCLDADTGNELWQRNMGDNGLSSPAVYGDSVYISSEDKKVYCLDADTGSILWTYYTGDYAVLCDPTVFDGKVYCGGGYKLICLDAGNGTEIWSFDGFVVSSVAVAYGNVYFATYGSGTYCLDAETGEQVWNTITGKTAFSATAVADLKVYTCDEDGILVCLDAETGEKLWSYDVSGVSPWVMFSSPSIADGRLYIGSWDGDNLYCFEDPSQPPDTPTIDGPAAGKPEKEYEYTAITTDPEGDDVYYYIDWGDDTNTSWIGPHPSGKMIKVSHTWSEPGNYVIRARAKDTYGMKSPWSELNITIGISNPPSAPTIDGPTSVKKGTKYDYTFNSVDPEGGNVYYTVVWGQSGGGWVGPYPSGETITLEHTWTKTGKFTIKAKAKDIYGYESDWGYLEVTVPRSKVISNNQLLLKMLQQFPNAFPLLQHLLGLQ